MAEYSEFEETPKNSVHPNIEDPHSTRVFHDQPQKIKYLTKMHQILIQTPLDRWIRQEVQILTDDVKSKVLDILQKGKAQKSWEFQTDVPEDNLQVLEQKARQQLESFLSFNPDYRKVVKNKGRALKLVQQSQEQARQFHSSNQKSLLAYSTMDPSENSSVNLRLKQLDKERRWREQATQQQLHDRQRQLEIKEQIDKQHKELEAQDRKLQLLKKIEERQEERDRRIQEAQERSKQLLEEERQVRQRKYLHEQFDSDYRTHVQLPQIKQSKTKSESQLRTAGDQDREYEQYRKKITQRLKQQRVSQEVEKPKAVQVKSQLHINPPPLHYTPVPKSVMKPSDYELEMQKQEELQKIHQQKETYGQMVREMYKPKVSKQLHQQIEIQKQKFVRKPRESQKYTDYLQELKQRRATSDTHSMNSKKPLYKEIPMVPQVLHPEDVGNGEEVDDRYIKAIEQKIALLNAS